MLSVTEPNLIQRLNRIERPVDASKLAELLGVSLPLIYKLVSKHAIPSFRVGAAIRFDTRLVASWLQGGTR